MKKCIFTLLLIFTSQGFAMPNLPQNIRDFFSEYSGCFLIKNVKTNEVKKFNVEQCEVSRAPYSTFKVLNALIGLETGVVKNKNSILKWDGKKKDFKVWEKDHDLQSAIKVSAIPYFQEIARRVGKVRMDKFLKKVGYGNSKSGTNLERFWLDGPLSVTAFDQLNFVARLQRNDLPFSQSNMNIVKEILVQEQTKDRVFSGKSGSDYHKKEAYWGWFIGSIKSKSQEYVFVTNIKNGKKAWGSKAKKITNKILKAMGI